MGSSPEEDRWLATRTRSRRSSGGCAASRARSVACSGWSTRTRTASTCSTRSRPRPGPCRPWPSSCSTTTWPTAWRRHRRRGRRRRRQAGRGVGRHRPAGPVVMRTLLAAFITLADIGRSLREAFFMFWETLWALVLGFTLSGAVQAFVSKEQMQRTLGDHRPAAVLRASGFGMVSSSCSYAASAMAKSLFQKGADFIVGHGVHVRLDQPGGRARHRAARADGLAVRGGRVRRRADHDRAARAARRRRAARAALVGAARERLAAAAGRRRPRPRRPWPACQRRAPGRARARAPGRRSCARRPAGPTPPATRWPTSPCSARSWSSATWSPGSWPCWCRPTWWNTLFVSGHGFWTSLENAMVGPIIAVPQLRVLDRQRARWPPPCGTAGSASAA